jgi:hypothetical protein
MNVCINCFNDIELKQYILFNSLQRGVCDYCNVDQESELIDVIELLDFFAEFLSIFKIDPEGIPLIDLIQTDWNLFSNHPENHHLLTEILTILNSPLSNSETTVDYIDEIHECITYWETFKEEIRWKTRFLSNIDRLELLGWQLLFNRTVRLREGDLFYRARLHYNDNQAEFEVGDMGCPERSKATAGRANPQGIPFLYLSKHIETTLYEIRGTFLDEVSVGTFKIKDKTEIILVDFTESASAFLNNDNIIEYAKSMLLKRFISADLSKPIRRYDSELEYIPTQFICEYIRYITGADGILFNSSLHYEGKNIVLFIQEKVECIDVQKRRITRIEIDSEII